MITKLSLALLFLLLGISPYSSAVTSPTTIVTTDNTDTDTGEDDTAEDDTDTEDDATDDEPVSAQQATPTTVITQAPTTVVTTTSITAVPTTAQSTTATTVATKTPITTPQISYSKPAKAILGRPSDDLTTHDGLITPNAAETKNMKAVYNNLQNRLKIRTVEKKNSKLSRKEKRSLNFFFRKLKKKPGLALNVFDFGTDAGKKNSILHIASRDGFTWVVATLHNKYPAIFSKLAAQRNADGKTPKDLALGGKNQIIIDILDGKSIKK